MHVGVCLYLQNREMAVTGFDRHVMGAAVSAVKQTDKPKKPEIKKTKIKEADGRRATD